MADLVEILVTAKNLTGPVFAEVKAGATGMEDSMSKVNKIAAVAGAGLIGFGVEAVKMASKFDSEMTLLSTQAGVSQDKIAGLSKGVLALSGKVAQDPDSLAEALFHVESNFESLGITSEKALKLTETAAKGATVGHANLVDVTNALTAAVASGIPGVQDFDQAMGVLNATVGVGDMKMQDLAAAFGGGMVATVKGFGLNIYDVGAALAVFGDNNIRGAAAGTQLRMSVMALAKPISTATDTLKMLGLTQTTLAEDMQKGGLKLALEDLRDRMQKAGISAEEQGKVITDAFGRKAGAGLNVLMDQMDRLESKYPALKEGANNFSAAWDATTKTFAFQMSSMDEKLKAFGITVGEKIIPKIQDLIGFIKQHKDAALAAADATGVLLGGLVAFSVLTKINALFGTLASVVKATGDVMIMTRVRMLELQEASLAAGGGLKGLAIAFTTMGTAAKLSVAATGIGLALIAIGQLAEMGKTAPPDIDRMTTAMTKFGNSGLISGELAKALGSNLQGLGDAMEKVGGKLSFMERFNQVVSLGSIQQKGLVDAKNNINAIDDALANMVKAGHADLAAAAVKRLQDTMAAQGKKPGEVAGELGKYNAAVDDLNVMNKLAASSMGAFGDQAVTTTAKLDAQKMTAEGLKQAILDLNDTERGAIDAEAGFEAAIDAGTKALDANGKSLEYKNGRLDLSTEKSRAEEAALSDLAGKTEAATSAVLKNNGSMDDAMAIYDRGRDKLITLAEAMGLSAQDAQDLADKILRIPDRTVTVTTNYVARVVQDLTGEQHSGGQQRASGGPVSGTTWVGEMGPELVKLPAGSSVMNAGQSRGIAAGAGGGGPLQVNLLFQPSGNSAVDALFELFRHNIRIQGGNVQTVLGKA